jgi:hypothetical protein
MTVSTPTRVPLSVGEVLADLRSGPLTMVDPAEIADLRAWFDEESAALIAELPPAQRPLRLPKQRMREVLTCETRFLAGQGQTQGLNVAQLLGRMLDACVHHHVLLGDQAELGDPVLAARQSFEADDATDELALLDSLAPHLRHDIASDLAERVTRLQRGWYGLDPDWWPRCESSATAVLCQGSVVVSGKFDVELGGGASQRPGVLIEVKSGRRSDVHRFDGHWYALLAALRDGVAPAAVITWTADDDAVLADPVYVGTLEVAVKRALVATQHLVNLLAGGRPNRQPGVWCRWCPARADCHEGIEFLADLDA